MAKFTKSPLLPELRGKLGGNKVSKNRYGPNIGMNPEPAKGQTEAQNKVIRDLINLSHMWSYKLSDEQYDSYSRIAGRLSKQRLDNIVAQPGFSSMPPGHQVEILKKIIETSRENARRATMMQWPDIMQKAMDQKRMILTTGKKK